MKLIKTRDDLNESKKIYRGQMSRYYIKTYFKRKKHICCMTSVEVTKIAHDLNTFLNLAIEIVSLNGNTKKNADMVEIDQQADYH